MLYKVRYGLGMCVCIFLPWISSMAMDLHAGDHRMHSFRHDSLSVYFEINDWHMDTVPAGNQERMDSLKRIIIRYGRNPGFKMVMTGHASPDGPDRLNLWLAARRVETAVNHLCESIGDGFGTIQVDTASFGVDWNGLERLLSEGPDFKGSEEALSIVRNVPVYVIEDGRVTGSRKKDLMELHRGDTYRYMLDSVFPALRRVGITVYYTMPAPLPVLPPIPGTEAVARSAAAVCAHAAYTPPASAPTEEKPQSMETDGKSAVAADDDPYRRLALKTNLLSDAALMPSLEAEYLIKDNWSIAAHGAVAWWSRKSVHKYYQLAVIYPEARWWFKTRKPWHGHYLGLFAGGTWYDLENGGPGYKGEGGFVGLSYGYMFPVGKRLSIEAGIGAGWLYTRYEEYTPLPYMGGTHYVYRQTSQMNYLGPLKLKLALVWKLWDDRRKGGAR